MKSKRHTSAASRCRDRVKRLRLHAKAGEERSTLSRHDSARVCRCRNAQGRLIDFDYLLRKRKRQPVHTRLLPIEDA
jgi:hypothetical protein